MKRKAISIVQWGRNRLDIFALGTDNSMYHKAWDGAWRPSQTDWSSLGGKFVSPPAAVSWDTNRLSIFGLGTDNSMYHKAWDGAWWPSQTDWEPLGGTFFSTPAPVSCDLGRVDIFGLGVNNSMYHKAWSYEHWPPSEITVWEPLGGTFASPPAAVSWGLYRLDIFSLGVDNAMWHKAWDYFLGGWLPSIEAWEPLGGTFMSPPAAVSWGRNRLDIFDLGTDNAMWHKAWDTSLGGWLPSVEGWESLGGTFTRPPAGVSRANNRLDIFALGTNNAMYHKAWDGAWHPSKTDWEYMGGVFTIP